jgi:hypothetical protein
MAWRLPCAPATTGSAASARQEASQGLGLGTVGLQREELSPQRPAHLLRAIILPPAQTYASSVALEEGAARAAVPSSVRKTPSDDDGDRGWDGKDHQEDRRLFCH